MSLSTIYLFLTRNFVTQVVLEGQDLLRQVYNCTTPDSETRLIRTMPFKLMPKPDYVASRGRKPKVHTGRLFLTLLQVAPPPPPESSSLDSNGLPSGTGMANGQGGLFDENGEIIDGFGEDGHSGLPSSDEESEWSQDDDGGGSSIQAAVAATNSSRAQRAGGTPSKSARAEAAAATKLASGAELAYATAAAASPSAELMLGDHSANAWGLPLMVPHGAVLVEINRVTLKPPPLAEEGEEVNGPDAIKNSNVNADVTISSPKQQELSQAPKASPTSAPAPVPTLALSEKKAGGGYTSEDVRLSPRVLTPEEAAETALQVRVKNATQPEKRMVEFVAWDGPSQGCASSSSSNFASDAKNALEESAATATKIMPLCCTVSRKQEQFFAIS